MMKLECEVYNVVALTLIFSMTLWITRLVKIARSLGELKSASKQDHVIRLGRLGSSMSLLSVISRSHLQHIIQTQKPTTPSKMKRVQVPFQIHSKEISIRGPPTSFPSLTFGLQFTFDTLVPCYVQVYWNIKKKEIDETGPFGLPYSIPCNSNSLSSILIHQSSTCIDSNDFNDFNDFNGTLGNPILKNPMDETNDEQPSETSNWTNPINSFSPETYNKMCQSKLYCAGENQVFRIHDQDMYSIIQANQEDDSRYPCVIVLFSPSHVLKSKILEEQEEKNSCQFQPETLQDLIVCQCYIVHFSFADEPPIHLRPVLHKQLDYSLTNIYQPQEIYGTDSCTPLECVICLEYPKTTTLLPCRHLCVCDVCLREIDQCPICRSKFFSYIVFDGKQDGSGVVQTIEEN